MEEMIIKKVESLSGLVDFAWLVSQKFELEPVAEGVKVVSLPPTWKLVSRGYRWQLAVERKNRWEPAAVYFPEEGVLFVFIGEEWLLADTAGD